MTLRVVFEPSATQEFKDAIAWYEQQRKGLGDEFLAAIEYSLAAALTAPERYPLVFGDIRRTVTHRFPYAIYFEYATIP
jgi:toxin ParE1/3/4